jgi:hypothetical protein
MQKTLVLTAISAAFLTTTLAANAERAHVRHSDAYTYSQVVRGPQVGPKWSGPNQCWTDEGYGRYAPCDGRQ